MLFHTASRRARSYTTGRSYPLFNYGPLIADDEIRVLKVSYVAGTPLLSMIHVSLANPPTYIAISYMWGSRQDMTELMIDGRMLRVRTTLKDMISDLCNANQTRFLWIDAICINQEDIAERNVQVRHMGSIYSRANYVIAYIKGSNHKTYDAAYKSGRSHKYLSLYSTVASIREAVTSSGSRALNKNLDYRRFFDNDYFVRRWIIQEVCLARSVIIRCDGFELSMGRLDEYFATFSNEHEYARSRAANICNLRRQMPAGTSRLEDLLYDHKNAVCAKRHDKVYALLSLSETAKYHIPIDYSMPLLHLLVLVVHTAWLDENLSESRTLSFACFLRGNLSIDPAEYERGIRGPIPLEGETIQRKLCAHLQKRGVIRDRQVDAVIEDGLHRLRRSLPALRHYPPIRLNRVGPGFTQALALIETYEFDDDTISRENPHSCGTKVDTENLWAFSYATTNTDWASPGSRDGLLAGMSTAAVQVGDEIWQFPRTPVGFIARPTDDEYTLVARALILNSNAWDPQRDRDTGSSSSSSETAGREFEKMIAWVRESSGDADSASWTSIAISIRDLLEMMRWADLFAD